MSTIIRDSAPSARECDICPCEATVQFFHHFLCGTCFGVLSILAQRRSNGVMTDLDLWMACQETYALRGNISPHLYAHG